MCKNLVEVLRNELGLNSDLEKAMFDILENNIDGMDLYKVKYYMENDAICSTGSVSGLIYYSETKEIFKENFEEIFELVEEYKEEIGEAPNFDMNYNNLVWFAFEWLNNKWFNSIDWDSIGEELNEEEDEEN